MANSAETPLSVPNEQILEETRLKLAIARERLKDLQSFGLTEAWLKDLETAADEAERILPYNQQQEELKSLTAAKNAALEACIDWGRQLRYRMQLVFANTTPVGMQFPSQEWRNSERNESRMIALIPSLIEIAKQHQDALNSFGQTEADIIEGEKLLANLKAANEAQEQYKFGRTTITAERRKVFRKLYDGVNRINKTGQIVYGVDSAQGLLFRSNWRTGSQQESTENTADKL
jgi:superfamily I DNA and/or RNA helicase